MSFVSPSQFLPCLNWCSRKESVIKEECILQGNHMQVVMPTHHLAEGSLQIVPIQREESVSKWNFHQELETFQYINRIVDCWKSRGITDYLIYAKCSAGKQVGWEIVPYNKKKCRIWEQIKVLWRICFGGFSLNKKLRESVIQHHKSALDQVRSYTVSTSALPTRRKLDAFCDRDVINRQRVWSGTHVEVLFNYAPIGRDRLHLLLVPKKHKEGFSDLNKDEYTEARQLETFIMDFYERRGIHWAYLYDKTGIAAGQTVPHWHKHMVFVSSNVNDCCGKLAIFKNMLFGASPLKDAELQGRIKAMSDLTAALDQEYRR